MKYLLIIFLVVFSLPAICQGDSLSVRISHHLRKNTLDYLPLPNTSFKATDFKIMFPDSMYNSAYIEIKRFKMVVDNDKILKKAFIVFKSENKNIKESAIAVRHKSVESFEEYLRLNFNFRKSDSPDDFLLNVNGDVVKVKKNKFKRQVNYSFTL